MKGVFCLQQAEFDMQKLSKNSLFALAILLLSFGIISAAAAQDSDKLVWSVTPYLWASGTSLDISVQDSGIGGGTEIPFDDLLDVLDAAFQIHVEAGNGNWSGFGDLTYIETSDTVNRPLLVIDSSNKQTVLDAVIAYWPNGVGSQLNVFGGLRYSGFDDRYRFSLGTDPLVEQRSTKDYYDALLGLRYRFDLSERWALLTRGDVSFGDLAEMLTNWGPCGHPCPQDVDGDGSVGFFDLLLLLAAWGPCLG